ncbi:MAG: proton-conducting transporter membrane subunit [Bacillota bacterium]
MGLILIPVFAPVVVSPLLLLLDTRRRRTLLFLYLAGMFGTALYILAGAELGSVSLMTSTFKEAAGMSPLYFAGHPYGKIAAFGFLLVGALALLYGLEVARASEQAAAIVAIGSAVGIAFAGNFLTLFIFWELLTVSTASLIILNGTENGVKMGFRFLILHLAGGLILFLGIMQNYYATGSFLLQTPVAGLSFFILGIGIKAVFLPLHVWLPWGYPSASFVSSVVLAGLTTKVGVFAIARILPPNEYIVLMGACMTIFGATCALMQSDLRRLLSFHIISQVGYMVAGAALGSKYGVDGSMLHLVNHMLYKALLFMSAGAIIYAARTGDMHDLHGEPGKNTPPIWLTIPVAFLGALVGALSISGTPLFNGYVSKYLLKKAMHGVGPAETMLLVAGVGTALSFCKFVYFGFIKGRARVYRELTASMRAAILAVSACCVLFGIWPGLLSSLLPNHSSLHVYSWSGAWASLKLILIGVVIFILIAKVLEKGIHPPHWLSVEYLLYRPVIAMFMGAFTYAGRIVELVVEGAMIKVIPHLLVVSRRVAYFDERTLSSVGGSVAVSSGVVRDGIHDTWQGGVTSLLNRWRVLVRRFFYFIIKVDYDPKGERIFLLFNMMNFDFDFVIFIFTLLLLLGASIFLL